MYNLNLFFIFDRPTALKMLEKNMPSVKSTECGLMYHTLKAEPFNPQSQYCTMSYRCVAQCLLIWCVAKCFRHTLDLFSVSQLYIHRCSGHCQILLANVTYIVYFTLMFAENKKKMQLDVDIEPTFRFSYMKCIDKQKDITMKQLSLISC